jgi:hypothetical protein
VLGFFPQPNLLKEVVKKCWVSFLNPTYLKKLSRNVGFRSSTQPTYLTNDHVINPGESYRIQAPDSQKL